MIFAEEFELVCLLEINEIKLTPREVDIISCIICGKTPQIIASFLSSPTRQIATRTVNSHISNIKRKIEGCARVSIIEWIENSDKLSFVRMHYLNLLFKKEFYKYFEELKKIVDFKYENILINIYSIKLSNSISKHLVVIDEYEKLARVTAQKITEDLEFFEIKKPIIKLQKIDYISEIMDYGDSKIYHINIIVCPKIRDYKGDAVYTKICRGGSVLQNYLFLALEIEQLCLACEGRNKKLIKSELIKYRNYPLFFLSLVENLNKKNNQDLENLRKKLADESTRIYGNRTQKEKFEIKSKIFSKTLGQTKKNCRICYRNVTLVSIICFITIIAISSNMYASAIYDSKITKYDALFSVYEEFTTWNLSKESAERNGNVVKKLESVITRIELKKVYKFFWNTKIHSNELINSVYNLNCISSYILSCENNPTKAQKVLKFTRFLIEEYLNDHNKITVNLKKLDDSEIYNELDVVRNLPELCSIFAYFMGRCNLALKNLEKAEKFFLLSKNLGAKSLIFESFISGTSLGRVKSLKAELLIEKNMITEAKALIEEAIKIYVHHMNISTPHTLLFGPHAKIHRYIIPKDDVITQIECSKNILSLYTRMIDISESNEEKKSYISSAQGYYINAERGKGRILNIFAEDNNIIPRIKANSCNEIGFFLLRIVDVGAEFSRMKEEIQKSFQKSADKDLDLIYEIFKYAKSLSRSAEFTKVDAIRGLIATSQKKLQSDLYTPKEKEEIDIELKELQEEMRQFTTPTIPYKPIF
ncbi:MAG: LuxR C-terminal-related transcriptional regulator [Rickettsiaceae bacterium]|nr:LuxR C-terminal-related transcriptional regulator [Rickettsiaceae bacterium]